MESSGSNLDLLVANDGYITSLCDVCQVFHFVDIGFETFLISNFVVMYNVWDINVLLFLTEMALKTASPPAAPSAQFIGNAFVEQYYHILHHSPESVHRFYNDSSVLSRPDSKGMMTSVTTMQVSFPLMYTSISLSFSFLCSGESKAIFYEAKCIECLSTWSSCPSLWFTYIKSITISFAYVKSIFIKSLIIEKKSILSLFIQVFFPSFDFMS